jgi:nucleoside-diphosphate-sugar epimerase
LVQDTARIIRCAEVDQALGEVINLGTGVEILIGEIVERVLALVGRELRVLVAEDRLRPPDSEVERLIADAGKARDARLRARDRLGRRPSWHDRVAARLTHGVQPSIYNV